MIKYKRVKKYLKLKQENKELKKLIKSYGEIIFNQAELINKIQFDENQKKINKAIEFIKEKSKLGALNYVDINKLLEILGEKE